MNSQYKNLSEQYSEKPEGYYEASRPEMLQFIPSISSSVLEIGCGSGGFGKFVKEQRPGTVIWGIEPDERAADAAVKSLDHVITGTFSAEMPELQGKTFDTVCFFDVLEHMISPESVLTDTKQFLSSNGTLVASIPNVLFYPVIYKILRKQDWEYEKTGVLDNTHLRFFTKKSIIRMFEKCGFEVVSIEGIHPFITKRYKLANILLLNHINDWKFEQFAIAARIAG